MLLKYAPNTCPIDRDPVSNTHYHTEGAQVTSISVPLLCSLSCRFTDSRCVQVLSHWHGLIFVPQHLLPLHHYIPSPYLVLLWMKLDIPKRVLFQPGTFSLAYVQLAHALLQLCLCNSLAIPVKGVTVFLDLYVFSISTSFKQNHISSFWGGGKVGICLCVWKTMWNQVVFCFFFWPSSKGSQLAVVILLYNRLRQPTDANSPSRPLS